MMRLYYVKAIYFKCSDGRLHYQKYFLSNMPETLQSPVRQHILGAY